jgi:hypothetical protein
VFGDATLRDTVAPLLVPCYDLATAAPFLFSRADAVESDSFDFRLRDVCAATCAAGNAAAAVRSVDGRTAIAAASGGVAAMGNPAAAAITHVLHNKQEFPLAAGVDDLLVVSIGSGSSAAGAASATPSAGWRTPMPPRSPSPAEMVRLTAEGVADMVSTLARQPNRLPDFLTSFHLLAIPSLHTASDGCRQTFYRRLV